MTADRAGQTGGEREVCEPGTCTGHVVPLSWSNGAVWCTEAPGRFTPVQPSGPVPVAGQAAREAAVEAVARYFSRAVGYDFDQATKAQRLLSLAAADELLSLPEVAALSAAPGQEPLHEWPCPNCGATTRARMADQQSAVRQAAEVLSDRELGDALDLWWAQREAAQTGQEQGR